MARRPFDPAAQGWKKVEYRQGDVLDRAGVERWSPTPTSSCTSRSSSSAAATRAATINLEGSRNVFEAAVAAGAKRLVYASSVAAYGFHDDDPELSPRTSRRADRRLLLLRSEGRGRGAAGGGRSRPRSRTPTSFAPASSPGPRR